jgi:hypothetical protein
MNAAPQTDQQLADEALEEEIEHARRMGLGGPSVEVRELYLRAMCALVKCRSPQRVAQMEEQRGIAR